MAVAEAVTRLREDAAAEAAGTGKYADEEVAA
jgi:hypothetical protein